VSRHEPLSESVHRELGAALEKSRPGYVVVADETARHESTVRELAALGFRGRVLVEKPLFARAPHGLERPPAGLEVAVGYPFRFHPVFTTLKQRLAGQRVLAANAYVGQYLPTWRPRDYRASYSARAADGGGVLRDLSHELDYALWLFGAWREATAIATKASSLEIDSEDVATILLRTERAPAVTIELNYLDRIAQRRLTVTTETATFHADLVRGTLQEGERTETIAAERDATLAALHRAAMSGEPSELCTWEQGLAVVKLIEAVEKASRERVWVKA
jgi:predicted dehydrogenase